MSRAFVDEDAGRDDSADLLEIPLPLPAGARNYSTPEGAARVNDELRELVERARPRALAELAQAESTAPAADGSVEVGPLRRRIAELDRRIAYLGRMASLLEVVEPPENPSRVSFGLSIEVEEEGERREYRIVGADESDPARGLLSWASPVARALVGKRIGERATVVLPRGERHLRILGLRRPEGR
jgi:transcription elongation factor GreB